MAESIDTDKLRLAAQNWNLDGDRKLLNLLQNIHQNITSRCMETSKRLNDMFTSLDHAKVSVDNVNNRFMSLSNTQFVESRVYEDDSEFVTPPPAVQQQKPLEASTISGAHQTLTDALLSIESNHERVTILDDSDSDSDDEGASVILRPKDVYHNRPLPFIIGSQSWRSKWHAGLIAEDSDTESMGSKKDEDLSESDESIAMSSAPNIHADANSFRSVSPASLPVQDDLYKPDMTRIYKPFAATNTAPQGYLFVDEPPPIDNDTDATSIRTESDSDDIFAELHKDTKKINSNSQKTNSVNKNSQSYNDSNSMYNENDDTNKISDEIKKGRIDTDVESDIDRDSHSDTISKSRNDNVVGGQFKSGSMSKNIPDKGVIGDGVEDKKPTGAVSLFGTKNAAESIGAAILRRNQIKSTSSEDDDEKTNNQAKTTQFNQSNHKNNNLNKDSDKSDNKTKTESVQRPDNNNLGENVIQQIVNKQNKGNKQVIVTEKNIFDELFAKSKPNSSKTIEETKTVKKVDVFSDIFDDIDDMFTSDVKIDKNLNKSNKKSIFDDFLSDVTVKTDDKDNKKITKSIFEDDDDLFNDPVNKNYVSKEKSQKNIDNDKITTEDKSFTNTAKTVTDDFSKKDTIFNRKNDNNVFKNNENEFKIAKETLNNNRKESNKLVKSIFDSDSDDGDIFSVIKAPDIKKSNILNKNTDVFSKIANVADNSNNLFEDNPSTDKRANNPDVISKNKESIKDNKNDKYKQTDMNEQDNNNSKYLFEKTTVKEVSQKLDTESNESLTNTDKSTLEINKAERSQDNDDKLDQNFSYKDDVQCDSAKIKDVNFTKQEFSNESKVFNTECDIDITNAGKGNGNKNIEQMPSNDSKATIKDTAEQSIKKDSDDLTNKNKDDTQNKINTSETLTTNNTQSNSTKTSEIKTSHKDTNVDNVENSQNDTFKDIFPEEPPEFEKAKEIKSNQNVNALFGDDSEDENLFFKKETLISDEKPDKTQVKPIDPLFGVFRDEPPDFDDDFLFKTPTDSGEPVKKVANPENKANSFNYSHKTSHDESIDKYTVKTKDEESTINKLDLVKDINIDNLLDSNSAKNQEETDGNTTEHNKTIGKLKPINFNINVTNLLPGASPKKIVKTPEDSKLPVDVSLTDGGVSTKLTANETLSTLITKDNKVNNDQKDVNPVVKSVSFDSDPESTVLDNKISKQRARIQVKRRPSTRQARKDAARKSVIDLDENIDTVDFNNENDERSAETTEHQTVSVIDKDINITIAVKNKEFVTKQDNSFINRKDIEKGSSYDYIIEPNDNTKTDITKDFNLNHEETTKNPTPAKDISKEFVERPKDDLENYKETSNSLTDSTRVLNINVDDIYIFREPKVPKDSLVDTKITTLGQVYHENTNVSKAVKDQNVKKKISIFDDDDDDDDDDKLLFSVGNTKRELPKTTKPNVSSIFEEDSSLFSQSNSKNQRSKESLFDDDSNLFSTGNSKKEILPKTTKSQVSPSIFDEENDELFSSGNTKTPKQSIKKSLFDDLSDDDNNLFGGKHKEIKKTVESGRKEGLFKSKQNKMEPKSLTTTLFDDDADDLFGSSSKSEKDTKSRLPKCEPKKETTIKTTEIFEDPLSMLNRE